MKHTSMKFRIKDEEHSKAIQEKLFELDHEWAAYGRCVMFEEKPFLLAEKCGTIHIMDKGEQDYFDLAKNEEYVLHNGELVPVTYTLKISPSYADTVQPEDISPKPIVSNGGSSTYYQVVITNKDGESINCQVGDIIRATLGNDFDLGNIYKALRRMYLASQGSGKAGVDVSYDANKVKYFAEEFAHWHKPASEKIEFKNIEP